MSFLNPAFLWALPSLAIPIALHMMQWQVPRPVVFPSIRFIKKASDADRGRRGLRDLLTLLARLCLMALIILLLAGPKMPDVPLAPEERDDNRALLLVDLSASMNAGDFRATLNKALAAMEGENANLFWALGSSDGIVYRTEATTDLKRLVAMTSKWSPTLFEGNHAAAISEASSFLAGSPSATCYLVSDFQAADWSGDLLSRLGRTCRVVPVPMKSRLDDNVSILRAVAERLSRGKEVHLRISTTVRNFSIAPKTMTLTCKQNDQSTSQTVTLAGGEIRSIETFLPNAGGSHTELLLDGAGITYAPDDSLWVWTGAKPPMPLALLSGDGGDNSLGKYFLGHALTVRQPGHVPIQVEPNGHELLANARLSEVLAVVALDAFRNSGPLEFQHVANWLEEGGVLICFAGDSFVNGLANLNTEGVCATQPGIVHGDRAGLKSYFLGKYDTDAPVLKPFAEAGLAFDSFPIFRYVGLAPPKNASVLIEFESGDPFLVRERVGKGMIYLVATGLSQRWSEFATSRQFLPLLRRLVASSAVDDSGADEVFCKSDPEPESPTLDTPGIVLVDDRPTVVNVSRLESNPDRLEPDAIVHSLATGSLEVGSGGAVIPGEDLTGEFAIAVLAFLLLEIILANANFTRLPAKKGGTA